MDGIGYEFSEQLNLADLKYNYNTRFSNHYKRKDNALLIQKPEYNLTKGNVVRVKSLTIVNYEYALINKKKDKGG